MGENPWRGDNEVGIQNYSLRHINAITTITGGEMQWKFMKFYDNP